MRSGGYEFQCLGPNGSQTPPAAFDYLQEKLGEKDAVDYRGFHIERTYYDGRVSYVGIIARQNSPQKGKQPVTFLLARAAHVKGDLAYGFNVSREAAPDISVETDWSLADLYPGACEQGVKVLGASGDLWFRQMDRTELGAYAYLFGTGVETLDYDPAIDYKYLLERVPQLAEQISSSGQGYFVGSSLFTQPDSGWREDVGLVALVELTSTLRTLSRSAALLPEDREDLDRILFSVAYMIIWGVSSERARELAGGSVKEMRMVKSLIAAQQK